MNQLEIDQLKLTALKFREKGIFTVKKPMTDKQIDSTVVRQSVAAHRARRRLNEK